jgi:WD40 repeat protein/tetratricopeptide (TPR) repeat protein
LSSATSSRTDGNLLAVGYGGKSLVSYVALWDIPTGRELARLAGADEFPGRQVQPYDDAVSALAFSPDGKYLAAGFGYKLFLSNGGAPQPKVWEVATRRLVQRLNGQGGYSTSLQFSPDGKLLAIGSRQGTAILWSTETWKPARTLSNPDKDTVFSGSQQAGMIDDVAFSPDGKTLAIASRERNVHLFDVATGTLLDTLKGHPSAVQAVVFSPDGRTLASGGSDQTVRLWNVQTGRELMQLDPGNVELGSVLTLAFSPDGKLLLTGGEGGTTAFWSAAPNVWNDCDRAADKLRLLLQSNADFLDRIRMLSENLRLHEALAKLNSKDRRVQAALAATQANWHASRQEWPEAVAAFDQLVTAAPCEPEPWLRTPGLLRLATALMHQNRPTAAAMLLQGGARRRTKDGLSAILRVTGFGLKYDIEDGAVRVTGVDANSPASRGKLVAGDVVLKVNGVALTNETSADFGKLLDQEEVGTKVRLIVRHSGKTQTEDVDLVKETYRIDDATGDLYFPLMAALEERLAKNPRDAGLFELRAELAGQESDFVRQAADYSSAIGIITEQPAEEGSAALRRLYRHRGDVYYTMQKWPETIADYAHVISPETTDALLLSNRARAFEALKNWEAAAADWERAATGNPRGASLLAEFARRLSADGQVPFAKGQFEKAQALYERLLEAAPESEPAVTELAQFLLDKLEMENATRWIVLKPQEMKSKSGASLTLQSDGSILVSGKDTPGDVYTVAGVTNLDRIAVVRLEALPDPSLPNNGPGRNQQGNFHLGGFRISQAPNDAVSGSTPLPIDSGWTNVDFNALDTDSAGTVDEVLQRFWSNSRVLGQAPQAYFLVKETAGGRDRLILFELHHREIGQAFNLGRFRLALSDDPAMFARERGRFATLKLTDPWVRLGAAYALNGHTDAASRYFGRALKRADGYEARKPILEFAARFDEVLSALIQQQPNDAQLQLAWARKLAARGKQRLAEKQPEKALVELEKSRDTFRRLRSPEGNWKVLAPVEMKAETGANMELQNDGSVFVSQNQPPKNDTYTLVFQSDLAGITGLRLEVLADSRLPGGGPGWGWNGNFVLSEMTLQAAPAERTNQARSIALRDATADLSAQGMWDIRAAIDGDDRTGWSVFQELNKNHTAVFELAEQVGDGQAVRLTVQLNHHAAPDSNLGRFRLSITNDATTLAAARIRLDVKDSELADLYLALGKAYGQQNRLDDAVAAFTEALPLAADRSGKATIIAAAAPLDGTLEKLTKRAAVDAQFQAELARHFDDLGNSASADEARSKARALFKEKLVKEPENAAVATELAQLLFEKCEKDSAKRWTVLKPIGMKSAGGATLTKLNDDSILASGENPKQDVYTLTFGDLPAKIQALRLEVLPHESLPRNGPGRGINGNFLLTTIKAQVALPSNSGEPHSLNLVKALADFSQANVAGAIDADDNTGWSTNRAGEPHVAVFELDNPLVATDGAMLGVSLEFKSRGNQFQLGRFRLTVSGDPTALDREQRRFAAMQVADSYAKLAAAYWLDGDEQALDSLLKRRSAASAGIGDLYAAIQDWERAIAEYKKGLTGQSADGPVLTKLVNAYQSAGRTRESVSYMATFSSANPRDTTLALRVSALQAWFGMDKELANGRARILASAQGTNEGHIADCAAKACSLTPSPDKAEREAALAFGRTGVKVSNGNAWNLLSLGMAEYRNGEYAAADKTLFSATQAVNYPPQMATIAAFYRAMSLFQQGKEDEARKLAREAAAKMKPLPKNENNPLADNVSHDDLILWLAYKEAKTLIDFETGPPPKTENGNR